MHKSVVPRIAATIVVLLLAGATPGATAEMAGPWDLRALRKTPGHEVVSTQNLTEQGREIVLQGLFYQGEAWRGKPTRVFAYYAWPAKPQGKLAAMVLVHGGGGKAFPDWARLWAGRGYAAIAMDLSGRGPDGKRTDDGGPEQDDTWKFRSLREGVTNMWTYHSVASILRAVSLLQSFPEVRKDRIGITGISWGGYLTSIAMSIDNRLKVAIPVYGCGFLHENSAWLPVFASLPAEERKLWIETFDPSSYLGRCRIPVLWMNGTNDFAYPLDSYKRSYRACLGSNTLCVTVNMPHSHPDGWARAEIHQFADAYLRPNEKGSRRPVTVGQITVEGNELVLDFRENVRIVKAEVHWTPDLRLPWQQRTWTTLPADLVSRFRCMAKLPKDNGIVVFVTLTDERGFVASSQHVAL